MQVWMQFLYYELCFLCLPYSASQEQATGVSQFIMLILKHTDFLLSSSDIHPDCILGIVAPSHPVNHLTRLLSKSPRISASWYCFAFGMLCFTFSEALKWVLMSELQPYITYNPIRTKLLSQHICSNSWLQHRWTRKICCMLPSSTYV